jgi:hypothetical protein
MSDNKLDPDLEEMWEEAERECRKLNGFKEGEALPNLTVEEVLKQLDDSKTKDAAGTHTKRGKAKEILQTTLVCIDQLGSIAAQGASMVSFSQQVLVTRF